MKTNYKQIIGSSLVGLGLTLASGAFSEADALPSLQLDILGGQYDSSSTEESVYTTNDQFTLYAYCLLDETIKKSTTTINDKCGLPHYISVAIIPKVGTGTDFGSFKLNGTTYTKNNLTFGNPPLDSALENTSLDQADLPSHSIFDTLFLQHEFNFNRNIKRNSVNVQNNPGTALNSAKLDGNAKLAYVDFNLDVSGLYQGFDLHFDLYNTVIKNGGDIDARDFAPFSHDARTKITGHNPPPPNSGPSEVPEPSTTAGLGLFALGGLRLLRKKK
jgi:hypothetical protein